jgi:hypothetical protein
MSTEEPLLCWYCGRRPAQPGFDHEVPLKRDEKETHYLVAVYTSATVTSVPVPRCPACWGSNLVYGFYRRLLPCSFVLPFLIAVFEVMMAINNGGLDMLSSGDLEAILWVLGFFAVLLVPARIFIAKHPRTPPHDYPPVAELLAHGWVVGHFKGLTWPRR